MEKEEMENKIGKINIEGIDKAELLKALYDNSMPLGLGKLHYDPKPMDIREAKQIIEDYRDGDMDSTLYFDYLHGRVMKVELSGDILYTNLYNRDNGEGRAEQIVKELRR